MLIPTILRFMYVISACCVNNIFLRYFFVDNLLCHSCHLLADLTVKLATPCNIPCSCSNLKLHNVNFLNYHFIVIYL